MRRNILTPIIGILFFFCFSANLKAQIDTAFVFPDFSEVCVGECVTFFLEPSINTIPIEWVVSTGETFIDPNGNQSFTYCFEEPGTYEITAIGDSLTVVIPAFIFVFDEPGPEIFTISDAFCPANEQNGGQPGLGCQKVCAYSSITYGIIDPNPAGTSNQWNIIGAESYTIENNGTQVTVEWGPPGQGIVEVFSFGQCFSNNSICIDIIPDPIAELTSIPAAVNDIVTICEGQTVYFENLSSGADTYVWDFGFLGSSALTTPELTFADAGTYEVALIARNACFCSDTTFLTIEVLDAQAPIIECAGTVCLGETVTYSTPVVCGTYTWNIIGSGNIIDGGGSSDDFITVEWTGGPEGYIRLEVAGCAGNVCVEPLFELIPIISGDAQIEGPVEVCREEIVSYTITPYDGTEYAWTVSSYGTILDGDGTNTIRVKWADVVTVNNTQWVEVVYENCYLECGGMDHLDVGILNEFFVSGPIEVCENGEGSFTANNVLPGPSFGWDWELFDNTGTSVWTSAASTNNVVIDFNFGSGAFELLAQPVNPGDYCLDEYYVYINVRPAPAQPDGIVGALEICPGNSYTYEVLNPAPGADYRWYMNDGGVISTLDGNPIAINWSSAGPYDLSVVRLSADGLNCESTAHQISIQPIGMPVLNGPSTACREDESIITATSFDAINYAWSINPSDAGTIISGQGSASIEVTWHAAGAVTVTLDLCGNSFDHNMTVNDLPQPTVIAPSGLCAGEVGSVLTSIAYSGYDWRDENGVTLSNVANPNLGPGHYEVIVTDFQGCSGNETFYIEEYPLPVAIISTPDNTGYCLGDPIPTIYALESEDGYDYQWFYNGLPIGGNSSSQVSIGYGIYMVEVTDINGCTVTSNTVELFEYCDIPGGICNGNCSGFPLGICDPGTDITFGWAPDPADCNTVNFTNTSTSFTPGSQVWDLGDGTTSLDVAPVHTYSKAGFYFVILTGLNAAGEFCWEAQPVEVPVAASFNYDPACAGDPMQFNDLSTFTPTTQIAVWNWDFGDPASGVQNVSFNANPQHTFALPGIYSVTLSITDIGGCHSSITLNVEAFGPPMIDFPLPALDCEGTALAFQANTGADVVNVAWDFGDPASGQANVSDQFNAYHAFDTPGNYTVTATATSIYGCSNSYTDVITVEPNLLSGTIDANPGLVICEGEVTTLTAPPGGLTWSWSTGEITESINTTTGGVYEVTMTDGNGCSFTPASVEVQVNPLPNNEIFAVEYDEYGQAVNYAYGSYTICVGEDVYLNVFEVAGQSYQWSNGEIGSENIFAEWRGTELDVGVYDIEVTVTNTVTGCQNQVGPFQITVNDVPADFTISADNNPACDGEITMLSVDSPDAGITYVWNTGQAGTSINALTSGEYFVTAYNASGCTKESNRVFILPGPDKSKIPSGCYTRCNPDTICLPNMLGVTSYQWYFNGTAIPAPEGTIANYIATQSGTYYVEMVDIYGCSQISDPLNLDLYDGLGDINGNVYLDVNENGIYDAGDTPLSGIDFNLLDMGGGVVGTSSSDGSGIFDFTGVTSSTDYTVELDTMSLPPNTTYLVFQELAQLVGCDDEVNQIWLIVPFCPTTTGIINVSACEGEVYMSNGFQIPAGTSLDLVLVNNLGCDSLLTINVAELPKDSSSLTYVACDGDPVFFNGVPLFGGSQTDFGFLNQYGCDSTITVIVNPASSTTTFIDLDICPGESAEYNGTSYFDGTNETFTYQDVNGCDSLVQLTVTAYPEVNFDLIGEAVCWNANDGMLEVLSPTGGTGPYLYSLNGGPFQDELIFTDLPGGDYYVTLQDANGCEYELDYYLETIEPMEVEIVSELLPCSLEAVTVRPELVTGDWESALFTWPDGSTGYEWEVEQPGTYTVTASNNCEIISRQFAVDLEADGRVSYLYIPNSFSPNGDGINDKFQVFAADGIQVNYLEVKIFDRWGNMLREFYNINDGWGGDFRAESMNPGVYVYYVIARVVSCGREIELFKEGDITIVK